MNNKKEYKKPKLNIVELATEEVLAAGCKFDNGGPGSSGAVCYVSVFDNCAGIGS